MKTTKEERDAVTDRACGDREEGRGPRRVERLRDGLSESRRRVSGSERGNAVLARSRGDVRLLDGSLRARSRS
jgi:hypothetical protein